MSGKSKLLTALSSMALGIGLAVGSADEGYAQACADVAGSTDPAFLQAVASDPTNACQDLALQRLVELAPAAGPDVTGTPSAPDDGIGPQGRSDASAGNPDGSLASLY